jgi:hypothetical protein
MIRVWWLGRLRVCVGNEDAPTGERIPVYLTLIWVRNSPRNVLLFSNYTGG